MNNKTALTGSVLLEAYWATRKKDMLDLIAPFVQYCIAKTTSVGSAIDISRITNNMRSEFGYIDIPEAVIIKVINRDETHYNKSNSSYYLIKSMDEQVERLIIRRNECLSKINSIGDSLYDYLQMHCRHNKIVSKEQCIDYLQQFFAFFALQLGLDQLEQEPISLKGDEINYYIAQYVFEKKNDNDIEYETILELTKGYLLRSAIYLQVDNPDIIAASYKKTDIYYDTPFLLQLLGFQSEKEAESAKALHNSLKKQGAQFYYFPQNEKEILSILTAYQYSLIGQSRSSKTLEGLDSGKYTFDDVKRIKNTFPTMLNMQYGIAPHDLPDYEITDNGSVDINKVDVSESDAIEYVRQHTKHYTDENLMSDVASALGIHRLRNGVVSQSIERCKALFVTTNRDFTRAFNEFYKENVGGNRVMPVITAFDLSAIAWVKGGSIDSDIPERQLLTNSYLAMQPAPELLDRCRVVLGQLEREGKITAEAAVSLRADRVTQRELWIEYFPQAESIDEDYIEKLQERQRQRLIGDAKIEIAEHYKREYEDDKQTQMQEARLKAKKYAQQERISYIRRLKKILIPVFGVIIVFCIIGLIESLVSTSMSIFLIIFALLSVISIIDTLTAKGKVIGKWIEKKGNYYETRVYEQKVDEYKSLLKP